MSLPRASIAVSSPDWLKNFRGWVARLPPAILADLVDVLALELRERGIGDHDALGRAAETVRVNDAARVQQLVDAFLMAEAAPYPSTSPERPDLSAK